MYLISTLSTDSEAAEDVLRKVRGENSQELTIQRALEIVENGKKLAEKIGFKAGDLGIIVNGRVSLFLHHPFDCHKTKSVMNSAGCWTVAS